MNTKQVALQTITIIDELSLQDSTAIEVLVTLSDDSRRWCFFCNSKSMHKFGGWISGTRIPVHYAPHMIVVGARLTADLINQVLKDFESQGNLLCCTQEAVDLE